MEYKPQPIPSHWKYLPFEEAFEAQSTNNLKIPGANYKDIGAFPIVDQGKSLIGGYTDAAHLVINHEGSVIVFGDHTRCFKLVSFPFAPGADGTKVLRPNSCLIPKFAYYGCLSLKIPNRGYSRHYAFLRKSAFPIAPIGEQHRVVAMIEELFSELHNGVEALELAQQQLTSYRKSVLKHAFAGKLTKAWRDNNQQGIETAAELLGRIARERVALYGRQLADWERAHKRWETKQSKEGRPKKPRRNQEGTGTPAAASLPALPSIWEWSQVSELADLVTCVFR